MVFVGHYGVAFMARAKAKEIPLWQLFIAVQLVDVFWALFVLLGIERARIVPGITKSMPLDLYYMPYTHSLIAAFVWSALAVLAFRLIRPSGTRVALLVLGLAVSSHWVLDLVVHRPDLPIWDDMDKVGLGLWNYRLAAFLVEGSLLVAGLVLYRRSSAAASPVGKYRAAIFVAVLLITQAFVVVVQPLPSTTFAALLFLASYLGLAATARWVESTRQAKTLTA
ncbi:MAG TPA: hypothetical protein VK113_07395 [Gemmatimonadales bacterium]|nr:hypothetical protein [Gemmatimonadales bacterium]